MIKSRIKYICYYNNSSVTKRNCAPSAVSKIDYIVSAMTAIGCDVEIVSVSQVAEPVFGFYSSERANTADGTPIRYFASWGGHGTVAKVLRGVWHYINLMLFLLFGLKRSDTVVAYHSLGYRHALIVARWLKGFKLIYEVEELYSDVIQGRGAAPRKMEHRMIAAADAYIFPSEKLNEKFNTEYKPFVVIYGSYAYNEAPRRRFSDDKVHVVYAGTFDERKGGALAAIAAVSYLPASYHLHICGFGPEQSVRRVVGLIDKLAPTSQAEITYDGLKLGSEYVDFIQRCDIGLSTQNPMAKFNDTSFPSKILSYMSYGLSVVSIDIDVVKQSRLADHITFYPIQDAEHIAQAIRSTNPKNNNIELIKRLDREFKAELAGLLSRWQS